jgi:MFS family permease
MPGLLAKDRIIAPSGYNRWLVPPAALAIHLSIGMAYGFSVFWLPLSRDGGWKVSTLGVMYSLFFIFLGSSAAIFGRWVEREGPRKAGFVAALCWGGGFFISALGIYWHQIALLWLGSGVIGGCGLGLGYISPVSTLIKWFPDRRGMATGMAIMGFGGGAMIGSPLADILMRHYATPTGPGVWQTFVTLGVIYTIAMLCGAFGYRLPPPGWQPAGWTPPPPTQRAMITTRDVHVQDAWKTPQFWLLFVVLCMNVSAGIGVIGMASPMLQEVFGGKLIGAAGALKDLTSDQRAQVATIGAGFAALLSLFNIAGRIFWASLSDFLGRKRTYFIFFTLGIVLYALAPSAGKVGNVALFVGIFCVILTMYGGGFATIPAYIADLFGTRFVGAIHGRILLAWSLAGVLGPQLVNNIREYQIDHGVPAAQAYNTVMYILAGLLVIGFFANLAVRPVNARYYMSDDATV